MFKGFQKPKRLVANTETLTERYGMFTAQPFQRGFGTTIGNSLRRVLLSSIEGAAITAVRIEGVEHEFSPIPGVVEDATDIILNLKQIPFKIMGEGIKTVRLAIDQAGDVRSGQIETDADVEVLDRDVHVATVSEGGKLTIEMRLRTGRGYVSADKNFDEDLACLLYTSTSVNEEIVHGMPNPKRILKKGDIVSIDTGVKLDGYYGDSAITVPIGEVSEETRKLLAVTRESLELAIDRVRNGNRLFDVCGAVENFVKSNGFSIVREYVGHGIGTQLHEEPQVPNYVDRKNENPRLKPCLLYTSRRVHVMETTIPHMVLGRFASSEVLLKPAPAGTGVIAGGAVRAVISACGIPNVVTKSIGRRNPHNVVKATIVALESLREKSAVAEMRGLAVEKL